MATSLLVSTSNANEALHKIFHPTCVSWNAKTNKWKYSIEPTSKLMLHLATVILLVLTLVTTLGIAFYCELFKLDFLPIANLLLLSAVLTCMLSWVLLEEGFLIFYGREMVSVANWATVFIKQLRIFPFPKNHPNLLPELLIEMLKAIRSNPQIDIMGIIAGYTYVSVVSSVFVIPFALVISDLDLVFIVLSVFSKTFGFNISWVGSWCLKCIRYISVLYVVQCFAVIPAFSVLLEAIGQLMISALSYLKQANLNISCIRLFKTLFIVNRFLFYMLKWFYSVFLTGSFFLLLITTNLCMHGKKFIPGQLYAILPYLAFTSWWVTALLLHFGNFFNKTTSEIIEKWRCELAIGLSVRPKYIILLIKSLRPIAVPVGDIGIVDRDIQINYFSAVLDYVVNTSIIFKDLF